MENSSNRLFIVLFSGLIFLSLAVFLVGNNQVFLFINQDIANFTLDSIVLKVFTPLFLFLGIVPFLMLFSKKNRALGAFSLISGLLCYTLGTLIKFFFKMPRPFHILSARIVGPWQASQFSFPSTTTMLAFGLALPFLIEKSKWRFFFLALSSLVGFSVIYTGFHFPRDVIGGIFFSLLIVFLIDKKLKSFLYEL